MFTFTQNPKNLHLWKFSKYLLLILVGATENKQWVRLLCSEVTYSMGINKFLSRALTPLDMEDVSHI